MNSTPRNRTKKAAAVIAGLAMALSLAACGSENDDEGSGGKAEPVAAIVDLSIAKGMTEITLDEGTLGTLTDLGVTPSPFGDATIEGGVISFPITGGNVAIYNKDDVARYVQGQVQHFGSGLSLEAGGKTVTVGNFNVDPTVSRVYGDAAVDGKVVANDVYLLRLDGRTLMEPTVADGEAVLEGSGVFLSAFAAGFLNDQFGIEDLTGDVKIGVAKITANVPPAS